MDNALATCAVFCEWLLRQQLVRESKRESEASEKVITKASKIGGRPEGERGGKGEEKGEEAEERRTTCQGDWKREGRGKRERWI